MFGCRSRRKLFGAFSLFLLPILSLSASQSLAADSSSASPSASADSASPVLVTVSNDYSVQFPDSPAPSAVATRLESHRDLKGWDHLFALLVDEGVEPDELYRIFSDTRMPERETLIFALEPREHPSLYRKHNTAVARRNALRFYDEHEQTFRDAEARYHVPSSLVLALLQIETGCGSFTGRDRVFHRLARLATAAAPDNIEENFLQKRRKVQLASLLDRIKQRAVTLQGLFLTHTAATITVARGLGISPLELRGSSAGAIGVPQFLPGNVEKFGVDGNNDGKIDVFSAVDSIPSVANFLSSYGWTTTKPMSAGEKRAILRHYNRSEPYVSTALSMSTLLEKELRKKRS